MRRLGFVYGEVVGRYPVDLAVLPFDHWQTKPLVGQHGLRDGLAHCLFDGLRLGV